MKAFNKWYVYLLLALAVLGILASLSTPLTGIQAFKIPTPSMLPTLQPGDRVMADLNAYEDTAIQYGDIVVFNSPKGGMWIFRVIGLPLDSIEVRNGDVYVNGQLNETKKGKEYVLGELDVVEFEEILNHKKKIKTLRAINNPYPEGRTMPPKMVPENEYFLMGDNRDDVYDSRFIGTIKKEDILGRVVYSYWGSSSERMNRDLTQE